MSSNKISTNIVFNTINQVVNVVVPLITAPYIARVLSAELIGSYSYTYANSSYFVLFGCLGLAQHGMIQTATNRNNKNKLSRLFWEITLIKLMLSAICTAVYYATFVANSSGINRVLYYIMTIYIVANAVDPTWILNGLEEFKLVSLFNMGIRFFNVCAILLFVKSVDDVYAYAIIMQVSTLFGFCAAFPFLRGKIALPRWRELNFKQHFGPALLYFIPGITHTIFASTDKTMLGALANEFEVGVYEQANKICLLSTAVISSISNVMLPRAVYLFHNDNDPNATQKMLRNTLGAIMLISAPITLGIAAIASEFVDVFYGAGYEKSAPLLQILSFNVWIVSISNVCGHQCLIARDKQHQYNIGISVGAVLNLALNVCLIPLCQSTGAALASVLASVVGLCMILGYGRSALSVKQFLAISRNYVVSALLMFAGIIWIPCVVNEFITMVIKIAVAAVLYVVVLLLLKDEIVVTVMQTIKKILFKGKK